MASSSPVAETRTVWTFDPGHTQINFKAKHMMVTNVRGQFTGITGKIVGDFDDPTLAEVDVEIDANSVDTRNEQRDTHLRGADFLDVENYPSITFRSTRIERKDEDEYTAIGDLTIRGVTRSVELDVTVNGAGKTPFGTEIVGISAETTINRKDFGLNWNVALEAGGWLVGDKITIDIEIQAVKS
jgi:polyisoprenoid-binding protein YceI